jgi:hypothetical protein
MSGLAYAAMDNDPSLSGWADVTSSTITVMKLCLKLYCQGAQAHVTAIVIVIIIIHQQCHHIHGREESVS